MVFKQIQAKKIPLLDNFLYEAIFVPESMTAPPRSIIENEDLQVYVRDFGQLPDDRCLVAECDGKIVGAVWTRIMNDYGHIDADTPSLAISLYKEYRNKGIGTELLERMLQLLKKDGYKQVSLSVQKANYAVRMYQKAGFDVLNETNEELVMVCDLIKKLPKLEMTQKHCFECGTLLTERVLEGEGIVPYCPTCEQYRFPLYNVAVSMIVINEQTGEILLIKQYGRPSFILVAGYVNRGEQLEQAVSREIKEETGMTVSRIKFNRTSFFEPSNTLMCNFTAFVEDASGLSPNGEIDSYQWFSPDDARHNIRPNSLAERFLNAYLDE